MKQINITLRNFHSASIIQKYKIIEVIFSYLNRKIIFHFLICFMDTVCINHSNSCTFVILTKHCKRFTLFPAPNIRMQQILKYLRRILRSRHFILNRCELSVVGKERIRRPILIRGRSVFSSPPPCLNYPFDVYK
jgi:hypothetical protein